MPVTTGEGFKLYTGHDPDYGMDLLLTVWDDGHTELATRPGKGQRWMVWSPPIALDPEPSEEWSA
jgi:hypothetical protein